MQCPHLWRLAFLAGVSLSVLAGCDKTEPKKPEPKKPTLEGRWSGCEEGNPSMKLTVNFAAGRFTYWDERTNELGHGSYVVNDAVQPAQLDMNFESAAAPDFAGKKALAIYSFEGAQLKIAGNQPGNLQRPTNFVGG